MYTRRAVDRAWTAPSRRLRISYAPAWSVGPSVGRSVIHHGSSSPRPRPRTANAPGPLSLSGAHAGTETAAAAAAAAAAEGARRGIISIRRAWWALRVPKRASRRARNTEDLCLPARSE
jgi:hypothetical protein